MNRLIAALALALAPIVASAATISGAFVEGGAPNLIDASGLQGLTQIDTTTGGSESFVFAFQAVEDLIVRGSGTILNVSRIEGFTFSTAPAVSTSFAFFASFDSALFAFNGIALAAGQQMVLTIGYDSALVGGDIDFAIFTKPSVIPLPGSVWAMLAGFAGLVALRRNRANA